MAKVFITGASGSMGSRLIPLLLARGHGVSGLVRIRSVSKLPAGCRPVIGDPLMIDSFSDQASGHDTFAHLVGVSRPAPWKAQAFREIDLESLKMGFLWHSVQGSGTLSMSVWHSPPRS